MKSTINPPVPRPIEPEYPVMKKHKKTGLIVLFYSMQKGVILDIGKELFPPNAVGTTYVPAAMDLACWEKFDGSVVLSN